MFLDKVQKEWTQILNRNMAKRIACIMPEFLEGTQSSQERLFDDVLTTLNSSKEKVMLEQIKSRYENICNLLGKERTHDEECIFVIQSPTNVYGHSKIQVPIHLNNGKKREFKGYELVSSRETSSSASYFVTNVEHKHLMYLALEKELYCQYRIILRGESKACGKFKQQEEHSNCFELFKKGFYDDTPDLVPNWLVEQYLVTSRVEELVKRFSTYEGPEGYKIQKKQIVSFFKQIMGACRDKNLIQTIVDGIYRMLKSSVYMDREFVVENCTRVLEQLNLAGDVEIIPLGSLKDGGKHISYYFNDIHIDGMRIVARDSLDDVLKDEEQHVVIFFDDGAYSGKQMVSMMQEYMGVPISERETTESHVTALSDDYQEKLKKMSIIYLFLAFNSANKDEVEKKLNRIGLDNVKIVYSMDLAKKIFDDVNLFESDEQKKVVKEYLGNVGLKLMQSTKMIGNEYKERWSKERVESAALGYNDAQQMVFMKTSVPTYTITPFWKEGKVDDLEWRPLFFRTIKEDN